MIVLINYASSAFKSSQKLNSKTGIEKGLFDEVKSFGPGNIESEFFNDNKKILTQRRGNGYWLWKPYFIRKTLELMKEGEYLFYCDSGAVFLNPVTPLIDIVEDSGQDILTFELYPHIEKKWTKRDAFILMDCDKPDFSDISQRLSGYSLWKKSKFTKEFIEEYLFYCQDERIITEIENQCGFPDYPEFKEHRHDQSIFSLLTKKYGLKTYRDPSQFGNKYVGEYPDSNYGQLIESTRRKGFFLVI